jgi:phosphatidylinositol alpha-1,6-mannosyltransferase
MPQKKHLILLTTNFKPNLGGISEYLHYLWEELSYFTPTTVLSTVYSQKFWYHNYSLKLLSSSSPKLEVIGDIDRTWQSLREFHPKKEIIPFIQSLDNEKVEIFIGVWHPLAHFWCKALRQLDREYSFFIYGQELLTSNYQALTDQLRQDLKQAQKIYACSNATAQLAKSKIDSGLNIETIYPGIQAFNTATEQVEIYKKTLNLNNGPILLSLCRLIYRKGIDLVLESLPLLIKQFPHLNYLIAGDGEEREKLEQQAITLGITNHVFFLGLVNNETKAMLFTLCDLFVMPVRTINDQDWEGFGITFLEAAITGKVAVGGKTGGVVEAIEDGVTGFLVDTVDARETGQSIAKLLENPNLRQEMGNKAKKRAQTFTWNHSATKLWQSLH